jgi:hypothetical protein
LQRVYSLFCSLKNGRPSAALKSSKESKKESKPVAKAGAVKEQAGNSGSRRVNTGSNKSMFSGGSSKSSKGNVDTSGDKKEAQVKAPSPDSISSVGYSAGNVRRGGVDNGKQISGRMFAGISKEEKEKAKGYSVGAKKVDEGSGSPKRVKANMTQ